jgi:hypothetical protein
MSRRGKEQTGQLGTSYVTRNLKSLPRLSQTNQIAKTETQAPKFGVSWVSWSPSGDLLAVREDSFPRCLWIWHGLEARLCDLLVQLDSIVCARWRPSSPTDANSDSSPYPVLAFCCNTPRVYFWTPSGSSWADLPVGNSVSDLSASSPSPAAPSLQSRIGKGTTRSALSNAPATTTRSHLMEQLPSMLILNISALKWSQDGKRLMLLGKDRFCSCQVTFDESKTVFMEPL